LARRATLIDELRSENPNLLLYDAGDFANDNPAIGEATTAFIVNAQGRLGYSAITLGARDLRYPLDLYRVEGGPRLVLSNVVHEGSGEPAAERWIIDEIGGLRVGVFSLLLPQLPHTTRETLEGYEILDPMELAPVILDELEAQDVDVIVLLSQLARRPLDELLEAHPEIDIAILGHQATPFTGKVDEFRTLTLYGTARGQAVATAEITLAPDGSRVSAGKEMRDLPRTIREDPDMAALVAEAEREILERERDAELRRMKAERDAATGGLEYVGGEACRSCHEPEHIEWLDTTHASAYETLVKLGMQQSRECLDCHVTGLGDPDGFGATGEVPDLAGVQCESCHGRGSDHVVDGTGALGGPGPGGTEAMCVRCHDRANSPDFHLESYMERIRHW
jgi:hypothetical protein